MLVMKGNSFFHSDLKVVLVVVVLASLKYFTFFLIGLSDLDDSALFNFLSIFQKICIYLKILFQKKANYMLMLCVHKEKNYQEIIKINITKLFI